MPDRPVPAPKVEVTIGDPADRVEIPVAAYEKILFAAGTVAIGPGSERATTMWYADRGQVDAVLNCLGLAAPKGYEVP